jgi:hypothetical protein
MALAIILSLVMGLSLGLLGGGGSILTVPILLYVVGMLPQEAIATSLIIVAVTSAVAMIPHARAGHVQWKVGAIFSAVSMVAAAGAGLVAHQIPSEVLLFVFVAVMVVTAIAMLRRRTSSAHRLVHAKTRALPSIARDAVVVGLLSGLVGAGGGFLIVPALMLCCGLEMRASVGTSLLVIALNSLAGFAGHATHATIDPVLAIALSAAAAVGGIAGAIASCRINPALLRKSFAWLVLAMAAFILYEQAPPTLLRAIFAERWPFWAGGLAVGSFVLLLLRRTNRLLGVSTGYLDACSAVTDRSARRSWRLPFLGGIFLGGVIASLLAGGASAQFAAPMIDAAITASLPAKALLFGMGGVLLGFGARLAGGCTSGHGIVGVALLSRSSLLATGAFMAAGFAVTHALYAALGG